MFLTYQLLDEIFTVGLLSYLYMTVALKTTRCALERVQMIFGSHLFHSKSLGEKGVISYSFGDFISTTICIYINSFLGLALSGVA